ncbi:MAG: VWA domain-containing protein [Acidobacteria bacterium]|nr:VWA domain-containing protein [Acidobacteriota bacterium]
MFFLNLSLVEFLALASAASAVVVALYLLDRSRRRQTVATLRFWTVAEKISQLKHRRRIQQPWSLILQLLSILLLLAALAQLRWGSPERALRDHVIVLDTSAWMTARGRTGTLLDEAKSAALAYVRALPASDRAMIVRADAIAVPATRFESSRAELEAAIRQTGASAAGLNLEGALQFARQAQRLEGRTAGEIVYAGAGRVPKQDTLAWAAVPRLRVLPVSEPAENCGLRKLSLRRSHTDPAVWEIFVAVRNYGLVRHDVPLTLDFGHAPIGSHRFRLAPGEEQSVTFQYRTRAGGWLEARLPIQDALAGDNRALLEVPAQPPVRVLVYSEEPDLLRPVLGANPNVDAVFARPQAYRAKAGARIVILDRFRPPAPPEADAIWIEPLAGASPFGVRASVKNAQLERWHGENVLGAGLRTRDLPLAGAQVFFAAPGDLPVADCAAGPVILARPGKYKTVAIGFHPGRTAMRFELATPLVFANILRWMTPEVIRRWELNGGSVGTVTAALEPGTDPATVRVLAEGERALPLTIQSDTLRFFTATPGSVRVVAGARETVFSLTLPDVADARWETPRETPRGVPPAGGRGPSSRDIWQVLAMAGALGLFAEWMLFGRAAVPRRKTA